MNVSMQRAKAAAGAVGVGLILVGLILPGLPPRTSTPVGELTSGLVDRHRLFLVGLYVAAIGVLALLWFLGELSRFVRDFDESGSGTVVAGGAAAAVLLLVGMAMTSGVAVSAARMGDPAMARAATDTGNIMTELAKFGLAALLLGSVGAVGHALSARWAVAGRAGAAVLVASALGGFVTDSGPWQFGGIADLAGIIPGAAWLIWLSVTLAHSPARAGSKQSRSPVSGSIPRPA